MYFMTAPETGGYQVMFCWMLPSSLTDTDPLIRPLTTPGVCAAESDLSTYLDSMCGRCYNFPIDYYCGITNVPVVKVVFASIQLSSTL